MRTDAVTPDVSTPGRVLASAREARRFSVAEVASRLKYSPRQIEAIEADEYHALPGGTIARGMIRGYAKLVGVDPGPLLEKVAAHLNRGPQTVQPAHMAVPFQTAPRRGSFIYVLFSIIVLLAVIAVAVEWLLPGETIAPATVSPAPATGAPAPAPAPVVEVAEPPPSEAPPPEPKPEPIAAAKRIDFVFSEDSWVEVRNAQNAVLYAQINTAGTQRSIEGVPPLSLVIGNSAGVRVRYDGSEINLAQHARAGVARLTLK
jgi:cytoskeleton protein RodZ